MGKVMKNTLRERDIELAGSRGVQRFVECKALRIEAISVWL